MTQNQLYLGMSESTREDFNEFLESNICIPKGDNRHPCADAIHQIAEDMSLKYQVTNMLFAGEWVDGESMNRTSYRIKPSEPVFEYQWLDPEHVQSSFDTSYIRTRFLANGNYLTEEEANKLTCYGNIYKIEETKRVRQ